MNKRLAEAVVIIMVLNSSMLLDTAHSSTMENRLNDIKVACLYERVTDGIYYLNRSIDDVISMLNETRTDFIFRGWWRWSPCPDSPNTTLPPEYPSTYVET